jgi:hypothetical protein
MSPDISMPDMPCIAGPEAAITLSAAPMLKGTDHNPQQGGHEQQSMDDFHEPHGISHGTEPSSLEDVSRKRAIDHLQARTWAQVVDIPSGVPKIRNRLHPVSWSLPPKRWKPHIKAAIERSIKVYEFDIKDITCGHCNGAVDGASASCHRGNTNHIVCWRLAFISRVAQFDRCHRKTQLEPLGKAGL